MRTVWSRLVAFGFRLLYNELAWTYDTVSWLVSRGLWRAWQRTALSYVPPESRVLEVGFGPGHLLVDLARAGHRPVGLDLSRSMLRQARRHLHRAEADVPLCRGLAQSLPFRSGAFDAAVLTFPTPFVYDPRWLENVRRVLRAPDGSGPGARLIVVLEASFPRDKSLGRFLEWLFRITGQRGDGLDLGELLADHGFRARRETVTVVGTRVALVLAECHPDDD